MIINILMKNNKNLKIRAIIFGLAVADSDAVSVQLVTSSPAASHAGQDLEKAQQGCGFVAMELRSDVGGAAA